MPRDESIVMSTDIHEYSCNEEKCKAVQTGLLNSFPPQGQSPIALSLVPFSIAYLARNARVSNMHMQDSVLIPAGTRTG